MLGDGNIHSRAQSICDGNVFFDVQGLPHIAISHYNSGEPGNWRPALEQHGTFGSVWASLGMTAYWMALIWINILLGLFLSPLFMIPLTWVQDKMRGSKA